MVMHDFLRSQLLQQSRACSTAKVHKLSLLKLKALTSCSGYTFQVLSSSSTSNAMLLWLSKGGQQACPSSKSITSCLSHSRRPRYLLTVGSDAGPHFS